MHIIDGKKIAAEKLLKVNDMVNDLHIEPVLAVVLIGDDPASHLYVKLKEKAAKEVGIDVRTYTFAHNVSPEDVHTCINFLNDDKDTHGIIVQLPLPEHLNTNEIIALITSQKDVDGFHPQNQEKFLHDERCVYPVFPHAIMELITSVQNDLTNKKAVIVGKSDVFDRIMEHVLQKEGMHTTFVPCDMAQSPDALAHLRDADVVVSACGKPHLLSAKNCKNDAIIIDGGISKEGKRTIGDVDDAHCAKRDITISPVPGGVGPVTIACLLENVAKAAKDQIV